MLWAEIRSKSKTDQNIRQIRSWTVILFVLIFGFFAVITILGSNVSNFRSESDSRGRGKINRVPKHSDGKHSDDDEEFRYGVEE